ncbi:hypothetical protein A3J43_00415 [Candidatus Uhrbacteria bacterium RIFCSPHIGHO2_12_FULL_54_23]|uniref:Cob(I)yrinic acid a,c-diamide adenosyltransferase n=2 Tax=Candidatus Uhriibacteriota TaxID=1752732 RepID=A0A1F7UJR0_9BACT|nr:MAG: hypothetical protein A3J43_00415 [Candidatus Uhrbacteria bacterium RIFCSPHIGHO2_12_FULL_54_23]OGL83553.1 MAG: hypothetical protein A3B36_02155 [Candidatus Uhrbacteria bacterium RIFCSPLOWO2_01_FULL_55_36]
MARSFIKHDKGLVIVYFGDGKGKTTAACGMAMRALGRGMNVAVLQFIKGEPGQGTGVTWTTGERIFADTLVNHKSQITNHKIGRLFVKALGEGFVKILGDKRPFAEHQRAAKKALRYASEVMHTGKYQLVVLDEVLRAVGEKLFTARDLMQVVKGKPEKLHLVLTGHRITKEILNAADLVTEMKKVKHPYDKRILAKIGVDF